MVKMVPNKTRRFAERPHYSPEDLDRECERIVAAFFRKKRDVGSFSDHTVCVGRRAAFFAGLVLTLRNPTAHANYR